MYLLQSIILVWKLISIALALVGMKFTIHLTSGAVFY